MMELLFSCISTPILIFSIIIVYFFAMAQTMFILVEETMAYFYPTWLVVHSSSILRTCDFKQMVHFPRLNFCLSWLVARSKWYIYWTLNFRLLVLVVSANGTLSEHWILFVCKRKNQNYLYISTTPIFISYLCIPFENQAKRTYQLQSNFKFNLITELTIHKFFRTLNCSKEIRKHNTKLLKVFRLLYRRYNIKLIT